MSVPGLGAVDRGRFLQKLFWVMLAFHTMSGVAAQTPVNEHAFEFEFDGKLVSITASQALAAAMESALQQLDTEEEDDEGELPVEMDQKMFDAPPPQAAVANNTEEKWAAYLTLIKQRNYFGDYEPGTQQYEARFAKARATFLKKHVPAVAEPAPPKRAPPVDEQERRNWRILADHAAAGGGVAVTGRSPSGVTAQVAREHGVSVRTVQSVAKLYRETGEVKQQKERKPAAKPVRDVLAPVLQASAITFKGKATVVELAQYMKDHVHGLGSVGLVHDMLKEDGWKPGPPHKIPTLSPGHKKARFDYVNAKLRMPWSVRWGSNDVVEIHIDEKWFYLDQDSRTGWHHATLCSEQRTTTKSKSNKEKVMFLAALARPNPEKKFDGKIGIWAVEKLEEAKRDSSYFLAGDERPVNVNMDREDFVKRVKILCRAAVEQVGGWAREIRIVMDSAGGHGGGRADTRNPDTGMNLTCKTLQEWADAEFAGKPFKFVFVAQPTKSPDLNGCDLGAWNCLQKCYNTVNLALYDAASDWDSVPAGQEPGARRRKKVFEKMTMPQLKSELDQREIEYDKKGRKNRLVEILCGKEEEYAAKLKRESEAAGEKKVRMVRPRDQLVTAVLSAWAEYLHPLHLERIFQTLDVVCKNILETRGDNTKTNHHHAGTRTEDEILRLELMVEVFGEVKERKLPPPREGSAVANSINGIDDSELEAAKNLSQRNRGNRTRSLEDRSDRGKPRKRRRTAARSAVSEGKQEEIGGDRLPPLFEEPVNPLLQHGVAPDGETHDGLALPDSASIFNQPRRSPRQATQEDAEMRTL